MDLCYPLIRFPSNFSRGIKNKQQRNKEYVLYVPWSSAQSPEILFN